MEVRAAALQFVRKASGYRAPSPANAPAFDAAVDEVACASRRLLASLGPGARVYLLALIFERILAGKAGTVEFLPREDWKHYMRPCCIRGWPKEQTERKTGLSRASYNRLERLRLEGAVLRRVA